MNTLIQKSDFIEAVNLKKYHLSGIAPAIMQLTGINRVNKTFGQIADYQGMDFVDALIERLGVKFSFDENDLKHIPKEGAFVVVSNHPFGIVDGILMMKILGEVRPDFRVMANFLLSYVDNIQEFVIPVNPFENQKKSSIKGMKSAFISLASGHPIGVFPAGEVSAFQTESKGISDREWQKSILKLVKKSEVPVVPIYFQGKNSTIFHLMGMIHPMLRTARLPAEMYNKKHEIKIRIGKPISVKEQEKFSDIKRYGRFLRAKTYAQGSGLEVPQFFKKPALTFPKKSVDVVDSTPIQLIENEINNLRKTGKKLNENKNFELFLTSAVEIPNILNEIGRLREITFRAVGEGTNNALDLDEYDLYYHHLFLWDKDTQQICGAYRIGKGEDILRLYGKQGFYIHSLFKIKDGFLPVLKESIELGRSFVLPEYQRKRLPLYMLWQGILTFLLTHPEYRYLIGPVSISNSYSKISKDLLVGFMMGNHYNSELAKYIVPRKRFRANISTLTDTEVLLDSTENNLKLLDKIIEHIEHQDFKVPVLFKKYLSLNAQIIGFNVDPKFSNALDGLMLLDFKQVPKRVIDNLKKGF